MAPINTTNFGRRIFVFILRIIYFFFLFIMVYQILVLVFGLIPVNKDFRNTHAGIEIFVGTNGVHTDIVMPVKNSNFDWSNLIPYEDYAITGPSYDYISIGWGDKGFYINTPTWADLTIPTAFNALFLASEAAMHVTYLQNSPAGKRNYEQLFISEEQYRKLIDFVIPYFQKEGDGKVILIPEAGYSYNDNFYEAHDHYHLFNTSNNWTNKALKKTGIRTPLWSPLDKPIMMQLRKVEAK